MVTELKEEIAIDPSTGLPELPEGYVWEVEENRHYTRTYPYDNHHLPAWSVAVKEKVEVEHKKKRTEPNPEYRWWSRNGQPETLEFTEVIKKEVLSTRVSKRIVRIKSVDELSDIEITELLARLTRRHECLYTEEHLNRESRKWKTYEAMPEHMVELLDFSLTEETIRAAAIEAYASFQDYLKREAEREANDARVAKLVGVYPPKKLAA